MKKKKNYTLDETVVKTVHEWALNESRSDSNMMNVLLIEAIERRKKEQNAAKK